MKFGVEEANDSMPRDGFIPQVHILSGSRRATAPAAPALTTVKIAVTAPMPSVSVRRAVAGRTGSRGGERTQAAAVSHQHLAL
jgi:hypothetical protein